MDIKTWHDNEDNFCFLKDLEDTKYRMNIYKPTSIAFHRKEAQWLTTFRAG